MPGACDIGWVGRDSLAGRISCCPSIEPLSSSTAASGMGTIALFTGFLRPDRNSGMRKSARIVNVMRGLSNNFGIRGGVLSLSGNAPCAALPKIRKNVF